MAPRTPPNADAHERRHAEACRREGLSYKWVNRGGIPVVQTSIGSSAAQKRKGARVLRGGGGGGDSAKDRRDAARLEAEAARQEARGGGCLLMLLTFGLSALLTGSQR